MLRCSADRDAARWAVYEEHVAAVRAYAARRVERDAVDDVVAETFAVAWRRLPAEADPLPWLYGVARKVVHGHRRSTARRAALVLRLGGHEARAAPDLADGVGGDPTLARAFAALSEREREAIRLVAWEGLDHAGAARASGCSVATFTVRLSRARARLRRALDAAADDPPAVPAPPPDAAVSSRGASRPRGPHPLPATSLPTAQEPSHAR
ncbi:RNA polymerase sigma factor [Conexibacter sp. SYSU D00693]|uniref:RNA polymerase sigma factor n=1 Tax=Conexibacter sp. SYSU D00693 TaxID=2812560 RepID=UPI001F12096C|nr:RNA polymerase sigma factor [Conexibacter sp. SYSU D00693]